MSYEISQEGTVTVTMLECHMTTVLVLAMSSSAIVFVPAVLRLVKKEL